MPNDSAQTLPPGSSEFTFVDPRDGPRREVTVYVHRPARWTPDSPIVLVMHGQARDGLRYRDGWVAQSDARGFLVAVPQFSKAFYPTSHDYNYGDMMTREGAPRPRAEWLLPLVEQIFDDVRVRAGSCRSTFLLFGHSAGGQLVHRLVTFCWSSRIEKAVAANSGSYTMPVFEEAFPFGLGGTALTEDERRAVFTRPLIVLLGDADSDPDHHQLPREPGAMRQGPHRFARGLHYMSVACREAAALGVPHAWKLRIAPGVAHSNPGVAPYAAQALFE